MGFDVSSNVELITDISDADLEAGDIGTIVEQIGDDYRVDFFQSTGREEDVVILPGRLLRLPVRGQPTDDLPALTNDKSRSNYDTLHVIEGTIGAFFAFAVGFVVLMALIMAIFVTDRRTRAEAAVQISLTAVMAVIEGWFLMRLKITLEEGIRPFAPRLAMKMRPWPLPLRLLPLAHSDSAPRRSIEPGDGASRWIRSSAWRRDYCRNFIRSSNSLSDSISRRLRFVCPKNGVV